MQEENNQLPSVAKNILLNLDKEGITTVGQQIVDFYTDGFNSPTEGLIWANKLNDLAEQVKQNLADPAANELKLGKGEKSSKFNCTITEQMVGVRYSYKECKDPVWNKLSSAIKDREDFLKTVKGSMTVIDEDTGEVVTVYEPVKSGKLSLVVKKL